MNLIFNDNYDLLREQYELQEREKINWLIPQNPDQADLDSYISPLTFAAFLGRRRIVELLLENPNLDLNLVTEEQEYSPLCCACMAGQFEIVQLLAENGANVNFMN